MQFLQCFLLSTFVHSFSRSFLGPCILHYGSFEHTILEVNLPRLLDLPTTASSDDQLGHLHLIYALKLHFIAIKIVTKHTGSETNSWNTAKNPKHASTSQARMSERLIIVNEFSFYNHSSRIHRIQ